MSRPSLEIHVPISPTPAFLNRVHYLAASLASRGGALSDTPIIVTVGADQEPADLKHSEPWSKNYPIEWRWLDRDLFRRESYYATAVERFCTSYQARNVMLLDADVLIHSGFEDLIASVEREHALFGMTAFASPWYRLLHERSHEEWWQSVFDAAGVGPVSHGIQHTGWGIVWGREAPRYTPPYLNLGVLVAPSEIMRQVGATIYRHMHTVASVEPTIYRCQIALTLAIIEQRLPWRSMSIRYNFPNHARLADAYARELADLRILHYLDSDSDLRKELDLDSPQTVEEWLHRSFAGEPVDLVVRGSFAGLQRMVMAESGVTPEVAANAGR